MSPLLCIWNFSLFSPQLKSPPSFLSFVMWPFAPTLRWKNHPSLLPSPSSCFPSVNQILFVSSSESFLVHAPVTISAFSSFFSPFNLPSFLSSFLFLFLSCTLTSTPFLDAWKSPYLHSSVAFSGTFRRAVGTPFQDTSWFTAQDKTHNVAGEAGFTKPIV